MGDSILLDIDRPIKIIAVPVNKTIFNKTCERTMSALHKQEEKKHKETGPELYVPGR